LKLFWFDFNTDRIEHQMITDQDGQWFWKWCTSRSTAKCQNREFFQFI